MLVTRRYTRLALWISLYIILCSYYLFFPVNPSQLVRTPKFLATDFSSLDNAESLEQFKCPSKVCSDSVASYKDLSINSTGFLYTFERTLSSGFEGAISIYDNTRTGEQVAVKSFFTCASPLRNILPESAARFFQQSRWPAELEFMLLYANGLHDGDSLRTDNGLVNIRDYFLFDDGTSTPQWQLVTPFFRHGTLSGAGPTIAGLLGLASNLTTSDLDTIFRTSFQALLTTLDSLHNHGFCHDDIKSDNIFISSSDPKQWLLGDFGNVREKRHPYHTSEIWRQQRQWQDCAKNDVRRLAMVYLSFLRSFHADTSIYDVEFLAQEQEWTRLYWDRVDRVGSSSADGGVAVEHGTGARSYKSPSLRRAAVPWYAPVKTLLSSKRSAKVQVDKELHCSFRTWSGRLFDRFLLLR